MKATEIYRDAIIKSTLETIVKALEIRQAEVLKMKGGWKLRALGIDDAIVVVRKMQKLLAKPEEKK